MNIAVLDWNTMTMNGDLSPAELEALGDTRIFGMTAPEEAAKNIGDADAVICNKVPITREVIENCPNLKYIGLFATGYNNIDIGCAAEKNITVCNAGQYSTNAVAQQTFAYILDHFSRIRDYDNAVREGKWERSEIFSWFPLETHELAGKTLSVVGFGAIGQAVAKLGEAFGMNVIVCTRTKPQNCPYELADLLTAAKKADVLTLHCPLTEQTKGMVSTELLSQMKSSAVLINTSRGGAVIEKELAHALSNGVISAAYLDVLDKEPMSADTPLKNLPNCFTTPHTAWAALETRKRLLGIVCDNFRAWQSGNPKNKVN